MGRVFACSDLHGYYNLYEQINNYLQPEDKIYFLGDAGDRGPEGWKTIKAIMDNDRWIYLKGNHEDMLAAAAQEALTSNSCAKQRLLKANGGFSTICDLYADCEDSSDKIKEIISKLNSLSTIDYYENKQGHLIILSHAGFSPYKGQENIKDKDLLWDRNHIYDLNLNWASAARVIHGHTPQQHIAQTFDEPIPETPTAYWYDEQKCCIDCWTYQTGQIILLDLDTYETILFTEGE